MYRYSLLTSPQVPLVLEKKKAPNDGVKNPPRGSSRRLQNAISLCMTLLVFIDLSLIPAGKIIFTKGSHITAQLVQDLQL